MKQVKEVAEYFNCIAEKPNVKEARVIVEGSDIHAIHDIDNIFIDTNGNIRITLAR